METSGIPPVPVPEKSDTKRWVTVIAIAGIILFLLIIFMVGIVVFGRMQYFRKSQSIPQDQVKQNQTELQEKTDLNKTSGVPSSANGVFAKYQEEKSNVKPLLPQYTIRASELPNLKDMEKDSSMRFSPNQVKSLETNNFLVVQRIPEKSNGEEVVDRHDNTGDEMADLYKKFQGGAEADRKPENALFVTSDFLLHTYHVMIDRTWQSIEQNKMQPLLLTLTKNLLDDSLAKYNSEKDTNLKESYGRLVVFYLVPQVLLEASSPIATQYFDSPTQEAQVSNLDENADSEENTMTKLAIFKDKVPKPIYDTAKEELDFVLKSTGMGVSPLYGKLKPNEMEDYSQYKPRSHYQKNSTLRSYFRAMMWFGRHGFEVKSADLTRDAILMASQMQVNMSMWENIYLPTVFFVGKSDDLTIYDYSKIITDIYGRDKPNFSDKVKLAQFQEAASKLQGPMILSGIYTFDPKAAPTKEKLLSDTKGFRFMGQRFIPDSMMLSRLTQGDEQPDKETGQKLPSTPTALMIMSILGSDTSDNLLSDWIKSYAPDSDRVIAKVKGELTAAFKNLKEDTWKQNIYWAWLYNILPLFDKFGEGYPTFMQNALWNKKSLVTALGSWTELRHDTLLYSKQSYAELGGGGPQLTPPPVPKGYVEPNLSLITRLIALNKMTSTGLGSFNLLDDASKRKYNEFGEALEFFKGIAEQELADVTIPDETYEKLRNYIGLHFPDILWPQDGILLRQKDTRTGLIADVHTDAKKQQILYEAIGTPYVIYVAVKDKGGTRLTRGLVYSYYEFNAPLTARLTDDDWQAKIYNVTNNNAVPPQPIWTNDLYKQ